MEIFLVILLFFTWVLYEINPREKIDSVSKDSKEEEFPDWVWERITT